MVQIIDCNVILDGAGGRREGELAIEIDNGRIASITDARRSRSPTQFADVVMPGMIDLHVHLAAAEWPADPHPLVARLSASEAYMALCAASNALDMLLTGFTTVRDVGAWGVDVNKPVLAVRDAINRGLVEGPRIYSAGWVGQTAGHNDLGLPAQATADGQAETADSPWQVRALVRKMIKAGCDLIKTSTGGGMGSLHEESWWPNYTPAELEALTDESHAYGKRVAVHAYHPEQIHKALDAGADTIEHGIFADEDCLLRMAELGVTWVPTLSVYTQETIDAKVAQGADEKVIRKFVEANRSAGANVKRAIDLGVQIGCGTDVYNAGKQFFSQSGLELVHLVKNGMTPDKAIQSATSVAANALGDDNQTGRVEIGMVADLVGLSADPTKDIGALCLGGSILWVMKGGDLHSAA